MEKNGARATTGTRAMSLASARVFWQFLERPAQGPTARASLQYSLFAAALTIHSLPYTIMSMFCTKSYSTVLFLKDKAGAFEARGTRH
jgi:hypothetical protein